MSNSEIFWRNFFQSVSLSVQHALAIAAAACFVFLTPGSVAAGIVLILITLIVAKLREDEWWATRIRLDAQRKAKGKQEGGSNAPTSSHPVAVSNQESPN
jgi:hypothetical protein